MAIEIVRSAEFSPCDTWRYTLKRVWDETLPTVVFILLNPSTADAVQDDPTNVRGIRFAMRWGYGTCIFVNLFAARTPDPEVMKQADDPIGPENDEWIVREAKAADKVVLAWGVHGVHLDRDAEVLQMLERAGIALTALGSTQDGHPKHIPSRPGDLQPVPWEAKQPEKTGEATVDYPPFSRADVKGKDWHVTFQELTAKGKVIEEHKFEWRGIWPRDIVSCLPGRILRLGLEGWKIKSRIQCTHEKDRIHLTAGKRKGLAFVTESLF